FRQSGTLNAAIHPAHLGPGTIHRMLRERVLCSKFLVDIDAEARPIVAPEGSGPQLGRTGKHLPRSIADERELLDAEVAAAQVERQIRGVANRRHVARPVPRGPYPEKLAECCQLSGRGQPPDVRDMDPDEIDQAVLNQWQVFG